MTTERTTELAGRAGGTTKSDVRAALFERIVERIHRYFVKLVWDPHAVDDCMQQTLLALERSLREGTYDPSRSFNRWMWIKAHSVYVDYCRARERAPRPYPDDSAQAVTTAPPTAAVDGRLDGEAVLARLHAELPAEAVEAFVLYYGDGQSLSEVARILSRDRKTARARLEQAKRAALRLLGHQPESGAA